MMFSLLEALIKVSEKAANIARVCRQDKHLFELLVEEKKNEEKNPRFVQDFKTLADVLIQETVKHDIGVQFPSISNNIHGEESNKFNNILGESVCVTIQSNECDTAELLSQVLDGDKSAAELLAAEVHKEITSEMLMVDLNFDGKFCEDQFEFGIWIDPIDFTAEYISGNEVRSDIGDIHSAGLRCVTVLIGVFDKKSGLPVIGVINQPFYKFNNGRWSGRYHWGICKGDICKTSLVVETHSSSSKVVAISSSESGNLKSKLRDSSYQLAEAAGAGYKLLCVATGEADVYLLSKDTTFCWDTCAPHALLKALGGNVINYSKALEGINTDIKYSDEKCCNNGGILAFRNKETLEKLVEVLKS